MAHHSTPQNVARATVGDSLANKPPNEVDKVAEAPGPALCSGRWKDWVKVKKRTHPAMGQVMEAFG